MHLSLLAFLSLSSVYLCDADDLFTAMATLEPLLNSEHIVASRINEYVESEMKKVHALREIAKGYHKEYLAIMDKAGLKQMAKSFPLNRFRKLKRVTADWKNVMKLITSTENAESFLNEAAQLPTEDDLKGASDAIFRLQDVYRLRATEMATGRIPGSPRAAKMNAHDAFELGRIASHAQDDYHAVLWLEEAVSLLKREAKPTVDEAMVLDFLAFSLNTQGNLLRAYKAAKRVLQLRPNEERARENVWWYTQDLQNAGISSKDPDPPLTNARPPHYDDSERDVFEALCRGEFQQTEAEKKKFYCYYKQDRAFLKLAPMKVEIVHFEPLVAIFRKVLSDREGQIIQQLAIPKLKRATVFDRNTRQLEHASYRITKSAWLKSEDHEAIHRINLRLEDMTNLDQETAEMFQVANYGLGGHYSPHFDHAQKHEGDPFKDGQGNRIATVLFYLNVPLGILHKLRDTCYWTSGGATVFINEGTGVFPQKNDALFWYNLRLNGEGDTRTRHAACPVLAGQKWVSNKWIHERMQEFRRPCGLEYEAEDYVI